METSEILKIISALECFFLEKEVFEKEFAFLKLWRTKRAFLGSISILGNNVNIIIGFDESFPFSKPMFFLVPFDAIGFIPHVDQNGYICYVGDDIIVDSANPRDVIEDCLYLTIETLQRGALQENKDELLLEFENYWQGNINLEKSRIDVFFSLGHKTKKIRRTSILDYGEMKKIIVGNTDLEINIAAKKLLPRKNLNRQYKNCLYITLPETSKIFPPKMNSFWTVKEFKEIIFNAISAEDKEELKEIIDYKIGKEEIIIVAIRKGKGSTLFGVRCKNIKDNKHPLLSENPNCTLSPLMMNRLEKEVIFDRGGADQELDKKKVLLIGCGSIGSKLSYEIIKTGISYLTLVDNDILKFENIYRHQLGKSKVGSPKTVGLQRAIIEDFPHTEVRGYNNKIETLILGKEINLTDFDLIICATGSPNTNFFVNNYLFTQKIPTPIIYTWNEPYGIGGHSLLIQNSSGGCYQCLFNDLNNRASFCEPNQNFLKKLAGCSSAHIPFSSIDSLKSTILSIELLKSFFYGDEKGNALVSWKGSDKEFKRNGFKTSNRFQLNNETLFERRYQFKNNECLICA